MDGKVSTKPVPVARTIHWLPTLDSHYVLAALEPGAGGRRQLFIDQHVLASLQTLTRNAAAQPDRCAVGLLLGRRYDCPVTQTRYVIIEGRIDRPPVAPEALSDDLGAALAGLSRRQVARVVGWYRSPSTLAPVLTPDDVSVHLSYLTQPWQTTLLFGAHANKFAGAFYLHDRIASRSFSVPFHELIDERVLKRRTAKPTCVDWPTYLTNEPVALLPTPAQPVAESSGPRTVGELKAAWGAFRAATRPKKPAAQPAPPPPQFARPLDAPREATRRTTEDEPAGRPRDVEKSREVFREPLHRVGETEDTTRADRLERYVELARAEGFFLVARFAAGESLETLWILHEPLNGLLLTIVADDDQVLEADLHYNLHTGSQSVLDTVFEEHRDLESGTVYLRDPALDGLRALCRRLRATGALVPEWKASPPLYLLTPTEWDSAVLAPESIIEPAGVKALNDHRIASLPEVIAERYRLRWETS